MEEEITGIKKKVLIYSPATTRIKSKSSSETTLLTCHVSSEPGYFLDSSRALHGNLISHVFHLLGWHCCNLKSKYLNKCIEKEFKRGGKNTLNVIQHYCSNKNSK